MTSNILMYHLSNILYMIFIYFQLTKLYIFWYTRFLNICNIAEWLDKDKYIHHPKHILSICILLGNLNFSSCTYSIAIFYCLVLCSRIDFQSICPLSNWYFMFCYQHLPPSPTNITHSFNPWYLWFWSLILSLTFFDSTRSIKLCSICRRLAYFPGIMSSRLICVVTNVAISLFLWLNSTPLWLTDRVFFIHSSVHDV